MKQSLSKLTAATVTAFGLACAHAGVLPGPLVDVQWLASHLDTVQVVEVRSNVKSFTAKPEFEVDAKTGKKTLTDVGGHIPNARLIDMKNMRVERNVGDLKVKYMIPERAAFEKAIQAAGIDADKPIVLVPVGTDAADVDEALRVYWQFKVYGEDNMAVLDGGVSSWLSEGRDYSSDAALANAGNWVAKADRTAQYFASSEDVAKAVKDKNTMLVDARDMKAYHGLGKRDYVFAYGHIENAKLFSPDLMFKISGVSMKFMAPNTYRALLTAQGVDSAAPSISYCNSGHLASGPWFVESEILGNKSARLYDGSMHEWTLEKRPVVGAVPLQ